jgi:hypothetical protein
MDELDDYVDILNIFTKFYQDLVDDNKLSLLDDISIEKKDCSSNSQIELLMEEIEKYKEYTETNGEPPQIYNPNVMLEEEDLLGLEINDRMIKISTSLLALIIYLSTLNWTELKWRISFIELNTKGT